MDFQLIQSVQINDSQTVFTIPLTQAATVNNLLIINVKSAANIATITVTDNAGTPNTYATAVSPFYANSLTCAQIYGVQVAGGATILTVTLSGFATSRITIDEFSGGLTSNGAVFDTAAHASGSGASAALSITPTALDGMVQVMVAATNATAIGSTANYVLCTSNSGATTAYSLSSKNTETAPFTLTGTSVVWNEVAGAYICQPLPDVPIRMDQLTSPVVNVSMNSNKLTNLTNGASAQDAAAFGQIPTSLPPSGSAGGDLTGTYPNPTIKTSVSLTTPVLNVATATSINGLTISTSTGTLTISNSKTLAASSSITLAGTDGKSLTLTTGLTVTTNDGTLAFGAASKTLMINKSLTLDGTDSTTMTFPSTSATIARTDAAQTFTGVQTLSSSAVLSSGAVTVSGNTVTFPTTADTLVARATTDTLTNKRITARVNSTSSSSTPTPNGDTTDEYEVTALSVGATFGAPTGTPTDGQKLIIRVKDNGGAQTLAWNAIYVNSGVATLPATTVAGKTHTFGFIYDSTAVAWICLAADTVGY